MNRLLDKKINNENLLIKKGIILAGGKGSRLFPVTNGISKHLLPIYDKPMIYYPLSTLMMAGVKDILLITTEKDLPNFQRVLLDGNQWGININYEIQNEPLGIPNAINLADSFLGNEPVVVILGDNFFHGSELISKLRNSYTTDGARIFIHSVKYPNNYGVANLDKENNIIEIEEKPKNPKSNYVVTGIYFFDGTILERAKKCNFSKRGETEIIDILNSYLREEKLSVEFLGRGNSWMDTGSWDTFHECSTFVKALQNRQGLKIGCPEEIAWRNHWIDNKDLMELAEKLPQIEYRKYLIDLCMGENL